MKIEVKDGKAVGIIKAKRIFFNVLKENVRYYPEKALHNFEWNAWEDFETDTVVIKMWGSIVSMMQYRKYLLMNLPKLRGSI